MRRTMGRTRSRCYALSTTHKALDKQNIQLQARCEAFEQHNDELRHKVSMLTDSSSPRSSPSKSKRSIALPSSVA